MKCPHCGKAITIKAVKRRPRQTTFMDVFMYGLKKGAVERKRNQQLRTSRN
jgi:hypothetical protein